jgi:hypothetical protein
MVTRGIREFMSRDWAAARRLKLVVGKILAGRPEDNVPISDLGRRSRGVPLRRPRDRRRRSGATFEIMGIAVKR